MPFIYLTYHNLFHNARSRVSFLQHTLSLRSRSSDVNKKQNKCRDWEKTERTNTGEFKISRHTRTRPKNKNIVNTDVATATSFIRIFAGALPLRYWMFELHRGKKNIANSNVGRHYCSTIVVCTCRSSRRHIAIQICRSWPYDQRPRHHVINLLARCKHPFRRVHEQITWHMYAIYGDSQNGLTHSISLTQAPSPITTTRPLSRTLPHSLTQSLTHWCTTDSFSHERTHARTCAFPALWGMQMLYFLTLYRSDFTTHLLKYRPNDCDRNYWAQSRARIITYILGHI